MRINYWCCSKFAAWIRGVEKPRSMKWGGWAEWDQQMKKERPIRFWLSDTLLSKIQDVLFWPFDKIRNIRYCLRNRFIDRVHMLPTRLSKWHWTDFDHRLLHAMMEGVVDYVETELGPDHRPRRSRERGLKHLAWEMSLTHGGDWGTLEEDDPDYNKPTPQAVSAKEVYELYIWWKDLRPNRVDPFDFVEDDGSFGKYDEVNRIEEEQEQEDTDMLIRLIKIRGSMWT